MGAVAGVGLYFVWCSPESVLIGGATGSSIVVWGLLMALRGSADERAARSSERQVRRAVKALEQSYRDRAERMRAQLASALVDRLDEADATEAEPAPQPRRDGPPAGPGRVRPRPRRGSRQGSATGAAPSSPLQNWRRQDIRDATEMIRFRYDTGEHLSRDAKAADAKGWSERQWDAAKANLDAAAVILIIKGQTEYPQTLDEALGIFGEYMLHVRNLSVPTVNKTAGRALYVESEEG